MPGYLEDLTWQLASGAARLSAAWRERHVRFLCAAQRADGGFSGRESTSDLYYTSFALRGLAVLGTLHEPIGQRAAIFLRSRMAGRESIVDFLSLIYSYRLLRDFLEIDILADASNDWRDAVTAALLRLRREDGGFAKGEAGAASSTYHTFLVLLCFELLGATVPEPEQIVRFVLSQEDPAGGFREVRVSRRGGTNPTAAAVASLRLLGALDAPCQERSVHFLIDMQTDEGGFRANTRIPIADLLSTFTSLVALGDLQATAEVDLPRVHRFITSLEHDEGGFFGAAWDDCRDVEYTFYGIGGLALLAGLQSL